MKLAMLIAALCTASCTAINLAPERPKPQLQRANKLLALRGGGLTGTVQDFCKSKSPAGSLGLFNDCLKASNGLLAVFFWSALYLVGALGWLNLLPGSLGETVQNMFANIYRSNGELGYIRFEILFILSAVATTAVLLFTPDHNAAIKGSAIVWAITFTLVVIKFHAEMERGWIADGLQYDAIQILHIIFAALLWWYGVIRGSAA